MTFLHQSRGHSSARPNRPYYVTLATEKVFNDSRRPALCPHAIRPSLHDHILLFINLSTFEVRITSLPPTGNHTFNCKVPYHVDDQPSFGVRQRRSNL